ncbi:MAG: hypothetical protein WCT31_01490 [Candidatus Micrarchaeia archaeon]
MQTHRTAIVDVLRARKVQLLDRRYWNVIGGQEIGAKAGDRRRFTQLIQEAGFTLYPAEVLASEFFGGVDRRMQESGIRITAGKTMGDLWQSLTFDPNEARIIAEISRRFNGTPLAVRSSAPWDSGGNGIGDTEFCGNAKQEPENVRALLNAIKIVWASQFSEDAVAFRAALKAKSGMAVLVEPVFGALQNEEKNIFGPDFGGIAYTDSFRGPYLRFAAGIPINVVNGGGVHITKANNLRIADIGANSYQLAFARLVPIYNAKYGAMLATEGTFMDLSDSEHPSTIETVRNNIMEEMNFDWLFEKLERLRNLAGVPLYVEWAVRELDGKPDVAITQISEVRKNTKIYDFSNVKAPVLEANYVENGGQAECKEIVYIQSEDEIPILEQYNKTHSGYLLLFDQKLIHRILLDRKLLKFHNLSNASAVIEIGIVSSVQFNGLDSHFGGALKQAGKIVASAVSFNPDSRLKNHEKKLEFTEETPAEQTGAPVVAFASLSDYLESLHASPPKPKNAFGKLVERLRTAWGRKEPQVETSIQAPAQPTVQPATQRPTSNAKLTVFKVKCRVTACEKQQLATVEIVK